ncbi:MAG: hypothetical protein H6773_02850 [Pseudomonadales bacterium]|uniref:LA2681-like HEPN domain-containing protein n=1 Tax=Candidatus Dojkabacteria bacterium TaxID=2099670 RepID=A0A955RI14_9BACT|nr:hypothetical protein [Candidatus Woesebacteria bacterium]MCA9382316.1 hypothetical protein [Candidatus Dojkabacteria bacterium]MCB9801095.1 hypothetical protein [Pseudomonadales bacterium]
MDKKTLSLQTISLLINSGEAKKALEKLTEFETENPDDKRLIFYKPGFLVDIGNDLRNENIIREGIDFGESTLTQTKNSKTKAYLHYCLANGYTSLYQLTERMGGAVDRTISQSANLLQAKQHLIQATNNEFDDPNLKTQLLINLGNCLDTLGRGIEAITAYNEALNLNKNFPMAIANRAKALRAFADISDKYRASIYVTAYQDIKSVLDDPKLVQVGGTDAKKAFERELDYIESLFQDKSLLKKSIKHPRYKTKGLTKFEQYYLDFCSREKLFLNFHIHDDFCEAAIEDPVFIRLITKIDDNDTFYNFAKQLNQIKEDYAVARLNLVQSQYKQKTFDSISKRTSYVYALDYSQFNLYVGLLKSAFKDAFNILDKIAVFINDYYDLGLKENNIYFSTASVWEHKEVIRKEILNSDNLSLYALYDIYRDFKLNRYQRIKQIRNALTHRRLIVFDSLITSVDDKTDKHNIDSDTFFQETVNLMRLTKAVIIYLINFVNTEEDKKNKISNKPILDMYVDTSQFL